MPFRQLDWDTCSAFDIIDHSILMHSSLFAECMQTAINGHHGYSMRTYHADMRASCQRWAKESARALRRLQAGKSAVVACDTFHNAIEAFNVAARLQLIPHDIRTAIIERSNIGKA